MQQLPNGQVRITNSVTGETRDVNPGDLPQYGIRQQGLPSGGGGFDFGKFLTNLLPTAGGIAGSVGGGALGTLIEPGGGTVAGSIAGGGAGQALGKFLQDLFTGSNIDAGDLLKQGATGALFGALPGGEEANLGSKLLARAGTGAALGAGSQAIQDFNPSAPNMGENLGKIGTSAAGGALLNEVVPGIGDAIGGAAKYVGQKLPQEIQNALDQRTNQVFGKLVGAKNVEQAMKEGVLPGSLPESVDIGTLQNFSQAAGNKINELEQGSMQPLLQNAQNTTTVRDFASELQKIFNKAPQDEVSQIVKTAQSPIPDWLQNLMPTERNQAAQDAMKNAQETSQEGVQFLKKFLPLEDAKGNVDLNKTLTASDINQIKQNMAKYYGKNQLYKDLYSTARQKVEDLSGNGADVKALNQRIHGLTEIRSNLDKHVNTNGALPTDIMQGANGNLVKTPSLQSTANIANGIISMIGYGLGHFPGYIASKGMEPSIDKMLFTPETAQKLTSAYNKLSADSKAQVIKQVFEQLGIRSGSAMGNLVP